MNAIRPIRDDGDHAAALDQIDALWGADPDSEEGQTLEVLITLVDAYESERHPISAPSPIEALLFRMDQLGLDSEGPGAVHRAAEPACPRSSTASGR